MRTGGGGELARAEGGTHLGERALAGLCWALAGPRVVVRRVVSEDEERGRPESEPGLVLARSPPLFRQMLPPLAPALVPTCSLYEPYSAPATRSSPHPCPLAPFLLLLVVVGFHVQGLLSLLDAGTD